MAKLTELEKQKVITCVYYAECKLRCDRYKLEAEYDKLNRYDEGLDKKIQNAKEMEDFYANLGKKLKEVL